mmetsp:Transcript_4251/g.7789  ORF Transcript_4251/g.7789 Transcript_4251/m.7789 type:complete len:214 (-) Transcript_4251:677-1318(-)
MNVPSKIEPARLLLVNVIRVMPISLNTALRRSVFRKVTPVVTESTPPRILNWSIYESTKVTLRISELVTLVALALILVAVKSLNIVRMINELFHKELSMLTLENVHEDQLPARELTFLSEESVKIWLINLPSSKLLPSRMDSLNSDCPLELYKFQFEFLRVVLEIIPKFMKAWDISIPSQSMFWKRYEDDMAPKKDASLRLPSWNTTLVRLTP